MANITKYLKYTSLAHTQHCLQNAEDKFNSKRDFLPDVDLFNIFLYATIYLGVILNINIEAEYIWKKI